MMQCYLKMWLEFHKVWSKGFQEQTPVVQMLILKVQSMPSMAWAVLDSFPGGKVMLHK